MAGTTRFKMAKDALRDHKDIILTLSQLKRLILERLGSDDRTVRQYLKLMDKTGLITEVEHLKYQINGIKEQEVRSPI